MAGDHRETDQARRTETDQARRTETDQARRTERDQARRIDLVRHRPAPALAGLVAGVVGMSERAPGVVRRRQPAGTLLPLVVSFGNPLTVDALADGTGAGRSYRSFLAGISTGHASTRFDGGQDCVQVYLTPLGARRVLGVPGSEVARRVVAADDVVPGLAALADRLAAAATWAERFALVEDALVRQVARADGVPPAWVARLWRQIRASGGQARIGDLVAETGWSHRHVTTVFRAEVGLTPKQAAGVVRFEAATADLGRLPVAEIAARHGYADQSHLTRDVVRYAGEPPAALAAARRPTPWTALGRAPAAPGPAAGVGRQPAGRPAGRPGRS
ncbi:helix-turn-helix domain-containing protein [Georgenia sp. TF02-10]|uniref:helix-turn-helix domain-containing protein n=1 Tax=Georgenia sp. TF02-10 TaxID=2917725 RepID=UPI001FA7864A|nr:helix-turn-helix domain-containing protein [Georgenia sp. TF02-10]UNX56238.1 helix-turn-helix domain-containing protein [Georgenia sp. TF02-10]